MNQLELLEALMQLDENPDIHTARLLILLREFCGDNNDRKIEGLTKLVKLDFLLRYPLYLSAALAIQKVDQKEVKIQEFEERSVESKMRPLEHGFWHSCYRKFINILVGKGLWTVETKADMIIVGLTKKGLIFANQLRQLNEYKDLTAGQFC